jgi:hypothetical protein
MAFAEEGAAPDGAETASGSADRARSQNRMLVAVAGVAVITAVATFGANQILQGRASGTEPGRLRVETQPAGAMVIIDGTSRGLTPLALSLEPGTHKMTIQRQDDERVVALEIRPGADVARYFEMTAAPPVAAVPLAAGSLSVVTDPPGARVSVDGQPAGKAPVTVGNLSTADHMVVVRNDAVSAERSVRVEAGTVASVVFALSRAAAPAAPQAGWLSIKAPFNVQVLEDTDVIGSGDMAKIMLPAGPHDIVLINRSLQYHEARKIVVAAGAMTSVQVDAPAGNLNANARPWAEVTIGGKSVGQTPIANLSVPIGTHDVVFRHPQLGERHERVTVTLNGPNRISVDLTK